MATIDQGRIWEEAASQPNNILVRRFSSDWSRNDNGKRALPDPTSYLPADPGRGGRPRPGQRSFAPT